MKSLRDIGRDNPDFGDRRPDLPPLPPVDLSGPDVPERPANRWVWLLAAGGIAAIVVLILAWIASLAHP